MNPTQPPSNKRSKLISKLAVFAIACAGTIGYLSHRSDIPPSQAANDTQTEQQKSGGISSFFSSFTGKDRERVRNRDRHREQRLPRAEGSAAQYPPLDMAALKKQDLQAIESRDTPFPQKASALMRLATQRDPHARDQAMELLGNSDPKLRMIAFRALGYFDESNVNSKLSELLRNKDPMIQQDALAALAWNPKAGSGREQILKDELPNLEKSPRPATWTVYEALYKMSERPDRKTELLDEMLKVTSDSKDEGSKRMALRTLQRLAPDDSRVQALSKTVKQ